MIRRIVLSSILFLGLFQIKAQDVLLPLEMNAQLFESKSEKGLKNADPTSIKVNLDSSEYIIVDDFSYNSHRPNNNYWQDRSVYVNRNFPINPITVGVATFDGLDQYGYPYNFINPTSYGPCDTLTTLPIELSSFDASKHDPIYLTFAYQPQGLSFFPNAAKDSIRLEFYQPYTYDTTTDNSQTPPVITVTPRFIGKWISVWGKEGYDFRADISCNFAFRFQTIAVHPILYQDSFQFRFISYGNTSGSVDYWHLDFIVLSSDANAHNNLGDYSFKSEIGSLIKEYESMPWFHYVGNEANYTRTKAMIYNMRSTFDTIQVLVDVEYRAYDAQGVQVDSITISTIPQIPAKGCQQQKVPDLSTHSFIFPSTSAPKNSTTYFIKKTILIGRQPQSDFIPGNDQVDQYQIFGTYYAYDDGSAEAGYGVKSDKGQVAVQFIMPDGISDTLTSFYIHFNPVVVDRSNERFRLTVWGNNKGEPGNIIYENSSTSTPSYPKSGVNYYQRWFLDQSVIVSDTFYIGYQKISSEVLNIGYDLNRRRNEKLFFTIGGGWIKSSVGGSVENGSLMIRPSFRYLKEPIVGIKESKKTVETKYDLKLYPNPVSNSLFVRVDQPLQNNWNGFVFSIDGKAVYSFNFDGQGEIDVSKFPKGMYILQLIDPVTGNNIHGKFLVAN